MSYKHGCTRPTFTLELKRQAVEVVVKNGYSFCAAPKSVEVGEGSLRLWHKQLAPKSEPCGDDTSLAGLRIKVQRLRKELRQAELEREPPKKSYGVLREGVAV